VGRREEYGGSGKKFLAPTAPLKRHPKRHISKLGVLIRKKVWRFRASLRESVDK